MSKQFAIFTFRDTGPLKTWAAVRAAQIHNSREKPIAHGASDIGPRHIIGGRNLVEDIKAALRHHGIDPAKLRKNGVIAYEAVLTASPTYFQNLAPEERGVKFRRWYDEQKRFVLAKYGEHRVVSMVLHLDEQTPHIHVVILPLEFRADGRSKDGAKRWALVGRTISGPGQFDRLQDEYARAMEPLGLSRGEVKSGRKHKPVREYLADLRGLKAENAKLATDLQAELARLREQALRTEVDGRAAQKDRQAAASARTVLEEKRAKVEAELLAIDEDRRLIDRLFGAMDHTNGLATKFMQMVKQFPESRWSEQTLIMAQAASEAAGPTLNAAGLLRAYQARQRDGR